MFLISLKDAVLKIYLLTAKEKVTLFLGIWIARSNFKFCISEKLHSTFYYKKFKHVAKLKLYSEHQYTLLLSFYNICFII